jgi:DNA-binding CsgD family transcriptional regulator
MDLFEREHPEMAIPFHVFRAVQVASEGRRAEAQMMLRPVAGFRLENIRPVMTWLVALAYAARGAIAVEDRGMASAVEAALVPYTGQNVVTCAGLASLFGSVDHYLGRLAATLGRLDDASRYYESAIDLETAMGAPPFVARTQVFYAELLLEQGDVASLRKAQVLAEEALATSLELKMKPWAARARAVLDAVAARGIEDHPLSKRELEVATLVSEGLTNHAIADRLHLSERTVESHVKNMCDKLGFNSRAQVAAWTTARKLRTRIP